MMVACVAFLFLATSCSGQVTSDLAEMVAPAATEQLATWVDAAYGWIADQSCTEALFTTEKMCRDVSRVPKSRIRVYAAEPTPDGPLLSVLPDGALSRSGSHDAVIVLDPFADASFGHLVVVFFVDLAVTQKRCRALNGVHLENGDCVHVALKNRCHNLLDKKNRRRSGGRRCEIHFLPLVHVQGFEAQQLEQRLECRSDLPEYHPCPQLRPWNETEHVICDPIDTNTKRCDTTHEAVKTRCRVFQICDHAVLISGGWNRQLSDLKTKQNVWNVHNMLLGNGFQEENIKIFYANGVKPEIDEETGEEKESWMFPSILKLAMRYHIRTLCENSYCADSLVIYLNSPARSDGSSLLWDLDGNGEVDETEVYTVKELLRDIQGCLARQVVLLVDQSFSGELVRALARSTQKHHNVLVFASSGDQEASWNGELTQHWANFHHSHSCLHQVHEASQHAVRHSDPTHYDGSNGDIRLTLFGAPCDVTPPFTTNELEEKYLGCQNIPTRLWISKVLASGRQKRSNKIS